MVSEKAPDIEMGGYYWLKIDNPNDYNRLTDIIDIEFGPAELANYLKDDVSDEVGAILVEYNYTDKDYRSTYYNFYAKMGRHYRKDCVRLHFFDKSVEFSQSPLELKGDHQLDDHYFGYVILRPTTTATLGRTLLSPLIRVGACGNTIVSPHKVHLLGRTLTVVGFPSMKQHADIAVCAHVSCWTILRHYSARYTQHRELLMHDITMLAKSFDPGGLTPSLGLNIYEAERVFQAAGCYPLLVVRKWEDEDRFFAQMLSYLDSGFPLFVSLQSEAMNNTGHAIVLTGYNWCNLSEISAEGGTHVWTLVDSLVAVDDNQLPYISVSTGKNAELETVVKEYTAADFNAFIVPLPDKIFYPAEAVEHFSRVSLYQNFKDVFDLPDEDALVRRYFITTLSALRRFALDNVSQIGIELSDLLMHLRTAQFIWVIEFASKEHWNDRHITARFLLDASASHKDQQPMWLCHGHDKAIVFDRFSGESKARLIRLSRPANAPLTRMESNLRPMISL